MRFNKPKHLSLVLVFIFSFGVAFAEEGAEEGAEGPPAEGDKLKTTQHPDAVEWYKRTQKLSALEAKLKDETKKLQEVIAAKNSGTRFTKDEKNVQVDILEVIARKHKELLETYRKFDEEKQEVKYRYPGEDKLVERRYLSSRPPTIEQLEKELGLDGQLSELSRKAENKYKHFNPPEHKDPSRSDGPKSTLLKTEKTLPQEEPGKKQKLKLVK